MKNLVLMLVGSALLAGTLSAGGCVSKDEYDKLWAMNRKANEELQKCQDNLRLKDNENGQLRGEIENRDRAIDTLNKQNANLLTANGLLRTDLLAAQKKLAELGQIKPGPLLPAGLNEALLKLANQYPGVLTYDANNGMVKFSSDLTFAPGASDINAQASGALKKLAEILNLPEAKPFNVYVAGHTDDMPISKAETKAKFGDNWGLSLGRAKAVVMALFTNGISQARMGAMGFSKYHPVAANAPKNGGNVANRRVELWIVPSTLLLTGLPLAPDEGRAGAGGGD
jgi:chemotaxis protein MotB